jgi:hypothetical protein
MREKKKEEQKNSLTCAALLAALSFDIFSNDAATSNLIHLNLV